MMIVHLKQIYERIKDLLKQPLIINILIVGFVTLCIKIVGFYKETVIASSFGLSELLDTFYIAVLIPTFVQTVFISALKNIFIPNYITEISEEGDKSAFQSVIFSITFLISSFFFIVIIIFMNFFLHTLFPDHSEGYYLLIKKQLYFVLPCMFFWGFSTIIGGLLDIANKFFFSSITPIFTALSIIICLLFFKEELGDIVIAMGMLIGSIISFIYLLSTGLFFKLITLKFPRLSKNSIEMIKQLFPKISSGFLSALNSFVDQFFAAQLAIGSISALNYGKRIPAFFMGMLILALGNVLLPHFSRLINTDLNKAYKQLFKILRTIFVSAMVIIILLILFSDEIISLLFERNEFTSSDTIIVSRIQTITLIYVPFNLCMLVLVRFLTSINKNKFMAWVSLFGLITNIILISILIKRFEVYGIAMATTIMYIVISLFYLIFTLKQYRLSKSIQ